MRETVDVFGGYDHRDRIGDGAFYEMENLSSDHYPLLSPRAPRAAYAAPMGASLLMAKDSLCYLEGGYFVINGYRIDLGLSPYASAQAVSMGANVILVTKDENGGTIDKKWINTADPTHFGNIDAEFTASGGVTLELCRSDGQTYSTAVTSLTAPESPASGDLWLDTSVHPMVLRQYSAAIGEWSAIESTYVRINAPGIGAPFRTGDGVNITGLSGDIPAALCGNRIIMEKGQDHIVITGILDRPYTLTDPVCISRRMPMADFLLESGNRLWGCRYGTANDGSVVNEIFASKLGDFTNWQCFEGISTDSYAVSVGSDGPFTGAITHLGYPLFFKENHLHKIYGAYPAAYRVQSTPLRGVEKGSHLSLTAVGEVLYYKGIGGIFAYDGSLPAEVSLPLGGISYHDAAAGSVGTKYYISMKDSENMPHLFVYDTLRGLWHREDSTDARCFAACGKELYYLDGATGQIMCCRGGTEKVCWMAQSGIIGTDTPDKKYITRLSLRLSLPLGASISVSIEYDSSGYFTHLTTVNGRGHGVFTLSLLPRRCDHFRLCLKGEGEAKLYSIIKTIQGGGAN